MKDRTRGLLLMTVGVMLISPDALLVQVAGRVGSLDALLFWRLLFTGITQFSICLIRLGGLRGVVTQIRATGVYFWGSIPLQACGNVCIVLAFATTSAANALVLFYLQPIWASMGSVLYFKDPLPRRTIIASVIGLCCAVLVFVGKAVEGGDSNGDTASGDVLALVAGVALSSYFMVCRACGVARPDADMGPAAAAGQLLAALVAVPLGWSGLLDISDGIFWLWVVINGCFVMAVPVLLITAAMRHILPPENALIGLLELLLAPIWVFLALGEAPSVWTLVGGILLLITLAWHEYSGLQEMQKKKKKGEDLDSVALVIQKANDSDNDDDDDALINTCLTLAGSNDDVTADVSQNDDDANTTTSNNGHNDRECEAESAA